MDEIKKFYYRIGEVATILGVRESAVRFWCESFGIMPKKSTHTDNRMFTLRDITKLKYIKIMKSQGYTLDGIKIRVRATGWPQEAVLQEKINQYNREFLQSI